MNHKTKCIFENLEMSGRRFRIINVMGTRMGNSQEKSFQDLVAKVPGFVGKVPI